MTSCGIRSYKVEKDQKIFRVEVARLWGAASLLSLC